MITNKNKLKIAVILAGVVALASCSGEGINRNASGTGSGDTSHRDFPGTISSDGPNRYVVLNKLNFEATLPSIISILFHASDQYGNAIADLQTSDFNVLEDNEAVSETETSLSVVPHEELPYSLKTVLMVDTSSSIQPADLENIKAALSSLIADEHGQSNLLRQQQIALYTFNDTVTLVKDFSSNTTSLLTAIDTIQPAGAITPTNLYGAVIEGASRWDDLFDIEMINQGALIIITDGTDTAARHTHQDAANAVRGKAVYTLGVGSELSADVMSTLGTAGSYTLRNFDQLKNTLLSIAKQVENVANSFYYLHYASPKRRADGAERNSRHRIELSVADNANRGSSGKITEVFNSAEFTNVEAQVVIAGPATLEIGQQATLNAATRWGPTPDTDYLWTITDETASCVMEPAGSSLVHVTGLAPGNCTISAEDQLAGGARAWYSVTVLSD
jgi:uncharacterized protein YegL